LFAQIRAFAPLAPADLCFTHLDEEKRWGKLWNFVLGTNYSIRFLSAGQNIPGNFQEASSDKLFISQLSAG
jgi:flagellar biosynthesis GTPase FlhF